MFALQRRGARAQGSGRVIPHAMALYNQKGGPGKTTLTAELAVSCARSGWNVLVVDLDPQANMARTLGYVQDPRWDGGVALQDAVATDGRNPVTVLRGIREWGNEGAGRLDVIAGGPRGNQLPEILQMKAGSDAEAALATFDRLLEPIADDYDLILFDLPPTPTMLHFAAFTTVHYIVCPVEPSTLSVDGLAAMLGMWRSRRALSSPDLEVLAVVVNRWDTKAKRSMKEFREELLPALGDTLPVLDPPIRMAAAADNDMKRAGVTAVELEVDAVAAKKRRLAWLKTRVGPAPIVPVESVKMLAEDTTAVMDQIVALFIQAQQRWADREAVS